MRRLTDQELRDELKAAKIYLQDTISRCCKSPVIARAEIQVSVLEELVERRSGLESV